MKRTRSPFRNALAVELARRDLTLVALAGLLRVPYGTLSGWINEVHREPPILRRRIEKALRLPHGTLPRDAPGT